MLNALAPHIESSRYSIELPPEFNEKRNSLLALGVAMLQIRESDIKRISQYTIELIGKERESERLKKVGIFPEIENVRISPKPIFKKVYYSYAPDSYFIIFQLSNKDRLELKDGEKLTEDEIKFIDSFLNLYHEVFELQALIHQNDIDDRYETAQRYSKLLNYKLPWKNLSHEKTDAVSNFWHKFVISKISKINEDAPYFFNLISKFDLKEGSHPLLKMWRRADEKNIKYPLFIDEVIQDEEVIFSPFTPIRELGDYIKSRSFDTPSKLIIPEAPDFTFNPSTKNLSIIFHDGATIDSKINSILPYANTRSYCGLYEYMIDINEVHDIIPQLVFYHGCWKITNIISQDNNIDTSNYIKTIQYIGNTLGIDVGSINDSMQPNESVANKIERTDKIIKFWILTFKTVQNFEINDFTLCLSKLKAIGIWNQYIEYKKNKAKERSMPYLLFDKFIITNFKDFIVEELKSLFIEMEKLNPEYIPPHKRKST